MNALGFTNQYQLESNNDNDYLKKSDIIDYDHSSIQEISKKLSYGITDEATLVRVVFEYVRDKISHSFDVNGEVVTCKASDVLNIGQGICYAKSHLLAALLRSLRIPTGFCYQLLVLDDIDKPWIIVHGLNAVYLKGIGKWIRLDARGNKEGVNAEFSLGKEKLAFQIRPELGEKDIMTVYAVPNDKVILALTQSKNINELMANLPRQI